MINASTKSAKRNNFLQKVKSRLSLKLVVINAALVVFVIYAFVTLVNQQIQISAKAQELNQLNQSIAVQEAENEEIKSVCNVLEQLSSKTRTGDYEESLRYIEKIAREDYGYVKKGERIFINIAGN